MQKEEKDAEEIGNFELRMQLRQIPKALFDYAGTVNAKSFVYKNKTHPPETLLCALPTITKKEGSEFHDITIPLTYKKHGWNRIRLLEGKWKYANVYSAISWTKLQEKAPKGG